jgi:hypothetical protein
MNELSLMDELDETKKLIYFLCKNGSNNPLPWISQKNGVKDLQL